MPQGRDILPAPFNSLFSMDKIQLICGVLPFGLLATGPHPQCPASLYFCKDISTLSLHTYLTSILTKLQNRHSQKRTAYAVDVAVGKQPTPEIFSSSLPVHLHFSLHNPLERILCTIFRWQASRSRQPIDVVLATKHASNDTRTVFQIERTTTTDKASYDASNQPQPITTRNPLF